MVSELVATLLDPTLLLPRPLTLSLLELFLPVFPPTRFHWWVIA